MASLDVCRTQPSMTPIKDAEAEDFGRQLDEIRDVPQSLDSPVNLDIREATSLKLPKLSWHNYEKPPKKMKITNTGQTVVLSGKWFSERPHLTGGALTSRYVFSQIHFHWGGEPERGSEHTVDGFRLPLEMHLVHFKAEYGTQDNALLQDDGLFVIGCFFKLQPEDNPAMSPLTDKLAFISRPHTSHNVSLCPIASLVAEFSCDYFSYWGSMCSDNCQHTILWCFPRTLVGISRQQMLQFQHLVNDEGWPLRLDEHSVNPLGNRYLFLVNSSGTRLSATIPGNDVLEEELSCSKSSSIEIFGSKTSLSPSKQTVGLLTDGQTRSEKSANKTSNVTINSALSFTSAKQTSCLMPEKAANELTTHSQTTNLNSTGKMTTLARDDSTTSDVTNDLTNNVKSIFSPDADSTGSRGQEYKDLCSTSLGNTHCDDHLRKRGDVLALTHCQEKPPTTVEIVKNPHLKMRAEIPIKKMGSSEEILKAIEDLRLAQILPNEESDNEMYTPLSSFSQEQLSQELLSQEYISQEHCGKELAKVQRYTLKAQSIAHLAEIALLEVPKTAKKAFDVSGHAPQVKSLKEATKKPISPRHLPTSSSSNGTSTLKPNTSTTPKAIPTDNINLLKVSDDCDGEASELCTRESPYLLNPTYQNSIDPPTICLTSKEIANDNNKALYDTSKLYQNGNAETTQGRNISAKSSPCKYTLRQQIPEDPPTISVTAKASPASITVSLAGCWKKSSIPQVAVLPEPGVIPCRVSPSDVRSVLDKLEREVSATLRHERAADMYPSRRDSGQEQECRTLVLLDDSLPSILGDQDSVSSLSIEGEEVDSEVISLYRRGRNSEMKNQDDYPSKLVKKVGWKKRPSSHGNEAFQSYNDERPMDAAEWRAERTQSLLMEATQLLKEHRRAVAETYDL